MDGSQDRATGPEATAVVPDLADVSQHEVVHDERGVRPVGHVHRVDEVDKLVVDDRVAPAVVLPVVAP